MFNPVVKVYATTATLVSAVGCHCEKNKLLSDVSVPLSLESLAAFKMVGCFTLDLQPLQLCLSEQCAFELT